MNFIAKIKNFFKEDYSDIVGIYYDGEKIFLTHHTDKIESDEINFAIDFDENISPTEQLADKISMILNQRGWQNSKIALCLNDDEAVIIKKNFDNIPENEIDSAVKTLVTAKIGYNAHYSFINFDDYIWIETLSETIVNNYVAAYQKNSLNLCALSVMPDTFENNRADFIAEILFENKSPNLLTVEVDYNYKKIFYAMTAFFLSAIIFFSANLLMDYRIAYNQLESAKKILYPYRDLIAIQANIENNSVAIVNLYKLTESHADNFKFNALIRLGYFFDNIVKINKIFASDVIQVEGVADNSADIENFRRNFDNSTLENSENVGDSINFSIKILR